MKMLVQVGSGYYYRAEVYRPYRVGPFFLGWP